MLTLARGAAAFGGDVFLDAEADAFSAAEGFHGEHDAFIVLFAEPAGFEEGHRGAAILALHGARPEVGHGGLRDPPRVGFVVEVVFPEVAVERVHIEGAVVL